MANTNNKDGQNKAGRSDSNTQNQTGRSGSQSHNRGGSMTAEEAGHLGGVAPHTCRGFECQKEEGHSSSSSKSKSNE